MSNKKKTTQAINKHTTGWRAGQDTPQRGWCRSDGGRGDADAVSEGRTSMMPGFPPSHERDCSHGVECTGVAVRDAPGECVGESSAGQDVPSFCGASCSVGLVRDGDMLG